MPENASYCLGLGETVAETGLSITQSVVSGQHFGGLNAKSVV